MISVKCDVFNCCQWTRVWCLCSIAASIYVIMVWISNMYILGYVEYQFQTHHNFLTIILIFIWDWNIKRFCNHIFANLNSKNSLTSLLVLSHKRRFGWFTSWISLLEISGVSVLVEGVTQNIFSDMLVTCLTKAWKNLRQKRCFWFGIFIFLTCTCSSHSKELKMNKKWKVKSKQCCIFCWYHTFYTFKYAKWLNPIPMKCMFHS